MVVEVAGGEGGEALAVEGVRGGRAGLDDVALVETHLYFTGDVFLGGLDEGLLRLAKRGEPLAFVDEGSEFVADIVLHGVGVAVEDELLELLVSLHEDGPAGSLIDAAGLHADDTVFHDIDDADAVLAAQLVELADDIGDLHSLAVESLRYAGLKGQGDVSDLIGSLHGSLAQDQEMVIVGSVCGILELEAFVADVPEVPVTAVAAVGGEGKLDAVRLAVRDLGFTGVHGPLGASPGSDDIEVGSQSLDAHLETDLVIALAGRAVADRGRAFLAGDLDKLLGDQRTCHGSTQQILVFIDGMSLYAGDNILIGKLITYIQNVELLGAAVFCAFLEMIQLLFLSAVDTDADDVKTVVFLQPGNDRRCVQTAAVCQDDFFFCCAHDK